MWNPYRYMDNRGKKQGGFPHTLHAGIMKPLGLREQPLWKLRVQLTGVFAESDFC